MNERWLLRSSSVYTAIGGPYSQTLARPVVDLVSDAIQLCLAVKDK